MDPITLSLMSVGGVLKGITDIFGGNSQADLMRQQAQLKLSTLEENMRRTEGAQTQVLSSTKARMAGTGFSGDSGSFTNYIKTMATEFDAQNRATHDQGLKSVDLIRQGADAAETAGWLNAAADVLGTGGQIAKMFG